MKNLINPTTDRGPSPYQLLVQSEEKERSFLETLLYLCLVGAAVASFWQFTQQPVKFTQIGVTSTQEAVAMETGAFHG